MLRLARLLGTLALLLSFLPVHSAARAPGFRMQEIDGALGIGYAVSTADMNGDRKPDVIAVSESRVFWYENPSWTKRVILSEGTTPRDNVCVAAQDLDGDGKAELALGAFWKPSDTTGSGSVHFLLRPPDPNQPWSLRTLPEPEPTVHRMNWADVDGDRRAELVVVPLQGRGTKGPDWEGAGVRIFAYHPPADPARDSWKRTLIDESLHVAHNFQPVQWDRDQELELLVASFEGVHLLDRASIRTPVGAGGGKWSKTRLAEGDQQSRPNRGCSEVRAGRLANGDRFLATIEPWHGNALVVYTGPHWTRRVVDGGFRGGHGLWCADLDGDRGDEIVAGWREAAPTRKVGLAIYRADDAAGERWTSTPLDDGGMACEDLNAADLNGDGKVDVIASGRATHNLRVYWNG